MDTVALRRALLAWYRRTARDLPWRRTRDPYAIWVSEIMLQQTRVDTVVPYYTRFLAKFPTVRALARAHEDAVLAAWSGLGYYRRARLLHAGAKTVVDQHGGRVPEDREARLALPGVGRYTAGAIGSIAFGLKEPLVDGNVARVLARILPVETPLGDRATEATLWEAAESLVQGRAPGAWNQALMELGALICTPKAPRCDACPVARLCVARRESRVETLPNTKKRSSPRLHKWTLVVTEAPRGRVVLVRGGQGLFGGLWAPPHAEGHGREAALEALRAAGVHGTLVGGALPVLRHVLTHRDLRVGIWRARAKGVPRRAGVGAFSPEELGTVGLSTLTRKALDLVRTP